MPRVNLHTIQGVKIGQCFSTGLGLGADFYYDSADACDVVVPIFLNAKGYVPTQSKVKPYFSFDIGAGVGVSEGASGLSGMYLTPAIGVKISHLLLQFGYNMQRFSEDGVGVNCNALQIKAGFCF